MTLLLLSEKAMKASPESTEGFAFGRHRVCPRQRQLLAGGDPVELGSRAFELLAALLEARGAVIGKEALMRRVWPDRIVADNNLQVQILALRNALGADRDLVRTVAGRGYQFTGEISAFAGAGEAQLGLAEATAKLPPAPTNLPEPITELIGRDADLREVLALAGLHRLVTLTGPGGIGKTRLAVEAARQLLPQFRDGVWIVDLSATCDPSLVPATLAASMGLELGEGEASVERVAAALATKDLLIVLDTCEHVIGGAAEMAEALLRAGAKVRVMATSREALEAYGEWIYRVNPLPVPGDDLTDLLDCRAVSLFIARAQATNLDFCTERRSVVAIAAICRRLDGIPLAIELAAARAATLGVYTLADRLDNHLQLLNGGRRTALPRHQTLRATLDWSYELLTHSERAVLRRLAIFRGAFGLEAAIAAAARADVKPSDASECLVNLVAKSLVLVELDSGVARYRLLETTRAYALEKLAESGEFEGAERRHAEYQSSLVARAGSVGAACRPHEGRAGRPQATWRVAA
jgi:predicted ATPase/DNA-binding winged helix-turn-helix (wHTH) protein